MKCDPVGTEKSPDDQNYIIICYLTIPSMIDNIHILGVTKYSDQTELLQGSMGKTLVFQVEYHPRKRTFKSHSKNAWKKTINTSFCFFFLIVRHPFFPEFVSIIKNTQFSILDVFCTPKRCTRVYSLVLKKYPNKPYVFR